ncbi:MAG: hypothetical protein K2H09_01045 [Treponemataceae bacterium]|nr:hypothetical protein [Treponemataceae bacterium]
MKSIKTYLLAIAALAAVLAVASCKDNDDDPSVVAEYTANGGAKLTFFDNDSFVGTIENEGGNARIEGSYSGSLDADGTITLTVNKASGDGTDVPAELIPTVLVVYGGNGTSNELKPSVSGSGQTLTLRYLTFTRQD